MNQSDRYSNERAYKYKQRIDITIEVVDEPFIMSFEEIFNGRKAS